MMASTTADDCKPLHIWDLGARPAIPPKQNEVLVACPDWIYVHRN